MAARSLVTVSSASTSVQALCVVATTPTPTSCSGAPISYTSPTQFFTFMASLVSGGGYQFNVKTTGLAAGTYQLLFRAVTPTPGEPSSIFHVEAGATFKLSK